MLTFTENIWLLLALAWIIPWKGVALWRAANNRQLAWFIALLVLNTMALLEIVYLFFFSEDRSAVKPSVPIDA